jgi:hypothetical protein
LEALGDLAGFLGGTARMDSKPTKDGKPEEEQTNDDLLEDMAEGPVDWLFSPKAIRQIFRQHYKSF